MNTKGNKKYQNSKNAIEKATLDFLKHSSNGEISISKICEKSGVNRSTFYRHFIDINDLYFQLSLDLQLPCIEKVKASLSPNKMELFIQEILNVVEENSAFFSYYLQKDTNHFSNPNFISLWENSVVPIFQGHGIYDKMKIRYYYSFYSGGFLSVVDSWIKRGYKESKEEVAHIIRSCLKSSGYSIQTK